MQPWTYRHFVQLFNRFAPACGRVLEIGAAADPAQRLIAHFAARGGGYDCIAVDLMADEDAARGLPYRMLRRSSNDLSGIEDASVDVLVSNAVLEHDGFFWKSLAEFRRVLRPGGLMFISVPGLSQDPGPAKQLALGLFDLCWRFDAKLLRGFFRCPLIWLRENTSLAATPTYRYHWGPKDYYRFTEDAVREIILEGFEVQHLEYFSHPPRIMTIGSLIRAERPLTAEPVERRPEDTMC